MTKLAPTGLALNGLIALFMTFDGVIHILRIKPVVDAFAQLGYPLNTAVPLGVLELALVALLLIPATRIAGAILLTGYLGGAIAAQVRVAAPVFETIFPALVGILMWGGVWLREPHRHIHSTHGKSVAASAAPEVWNG